ncbi:MAG: hypothetical protein ORN54_15415, partial [Cyclobacteriaceae bacterium]|nr:hypothetical protein [Cyclobacteriaceae bacterium]
TRNTVYFELQLQQQDKPTSDGINKQLETGPSYSVVKDGPGEAGDIFRLQSTILRKVQKPDGTPVKFSHVGPGILNIVVVCISDILLGMPDIFDCLLTLYGDSEVPGHCWRGVFGLFQDANIADTDEFRARAVKYAHVKSTVHGVLFLFRPKGSGGLDYQLQQIMVWNRCLASADQAKGLTEQISEALPVKLNQGKSLIV